MNGRYTWKEIQTIVISIWTSWNTLSLLWLFPGYDHRLVLDRGKWCQKYHEESQLNKPQISFLLRIELNLIYLSLNIDFTPPDSLLHLVMATVRCFSFPHEVKLSHYVYDTIYFVATVKFTQPVTFIPYTCEMTNSSSTTFPILFRLYRTWDMTNSKQLVSLS